MKKIYLILFGIILILQQQVFAAIETVFTPSISISETYDDNIDLDKTDKINDWITSISPGITIASGQRWSANATGMAEWTPNCLAS